MSDTTNESILFAEEEQTMLPDGWAEGDDFFDTDNWTGESESADASSEDAGAEEVSDEENGSAAEDPTTVGAEDASDSAEETETLPTTQPETKPAKLRFSATVDHRTQNVELDEADLPTIYQKAQVTDRVQDRLKNMTPIMEKAEKAAKLLGYESVDEMLNASMDNYRESEVEKLVNDGTPKLIAEDYIDRKMNPPAPAPEKSGERNWEEEALTLLDAFPELKGQPIPDEVLNDSITTGKRLVSAYREYYDKQQKAANDANNAEKNALKKANKILKQNAEAASRAPVRGVSGSGVDETAEDDAFLKGFNADDDAWN